MQCDDEAVDFSVIPRCVAFTKSGGFSALSNVRVKNDNCSTSHEVYLHGYIFAKL